MVVLSSGGHYCCDGQCAALMAQTCERRLLRMARVLNVQESWIIITKKKGSGMTHA